MKTRGRRLLHILLILAAMLAVLARTAYAAPRDRNNDNETTVAEITATTSPAPTSADGPAVATDENGEPAPEEPPEPTEPTARWESPTDEFGNPLFPPPPTTTTTTAPTTTKKPTTRPFVVNPAHPEDTYNGPLGLRPNPDLYETNDETSAAEVTTTATTQEWTMPEEQGYEPGADMRKIIGIAAAAILPIALIVAVAMMAKGKREEQRETMREAQRAAREKAAAKREAQAASAAAPPEAAAPATPLLNPLPPPVGSPLDPEAQDGKTPEPGADEPVRADEPNHKDFLARFDEENPWFLHSLEPQKQKKEDKREDSEDGESS